MASKGFEQIPPLLPSLSLNQGWFGQGDAGVGDGINLTPQIEIETAALRRLVDGHPVNQPSHQLLRLRLGFRTAVPPPSRHDPP